MCVLYLCQVQGKGLWCLGGTAGFLGVESEGKVRKISPSPSVTFLSFKSK